MSSYPGDERWAMEQARRTEAAMMSDPTPTDVPALVDRLRERQADFEMVARHGICVQSTPERLAGEYQEAADALTALRLDVQRITEERDAAKSAQYISCLFCDERRYRGDEPTAVRDAWEWVKHHAVTCQQHPAVQRMRSAEADRDAQVREAFDAGYFAEDWPKTCPCDVCQHARADADAAFAAYLRERQDGKETAK
jgi:hypothetical protein